MVLFVDYFWICEYKLKWYIGDIQMIKKIEEMN
jgi:hypothetical protein